MRLSLPSAAILGLLSLTAWAVADPKAEIEKFAGTWKVLSADFDEMAVPEDRRDKIKIVFDGEKVNFIENDSDAKSTFTVDDSKKPATIDITPPRGKKEVLTGIYKFDNDKLTLCLTSTGERPTAFKAGKKVLLLVLEKEKK
jgi:uncharacterized protein (TIGR03067 family)